MKLIIIFLFVSINAFAVEKNNSKKPNKVEVTIKGLDAKKIYELLKNQETEKAAEEDGTFYCSKYAKGVQCLRWRTIKNDADEKNYECTFETDSEGIILEPSPHY